MTASTTAGIIPTATDQAAELPWKQELNHLPIPYKPHTHLTGDAAIQFTVRVVKAYGMGATIRDIGEHTPRSFGTVHRSLLKAGVKLRGRGGAHDGVRLPVA
ncbi:helix-turn-helix domain-containing protein [Streptomyces sp. GbtcB6]|uniref:helix-turn-helix domain-containing protein n=1 Tax=Streptomyces sp. GbtcB6 TaxID=2824751 RepID=UPI002670D0A3|nr:helix-turn-helix domain-containing protein [Streptomyces sp. GbtcB6]